MAKEKTVTVYEVLYDGTGPGPMGDGTFVARFGPKRKDAADAFAAAHTCYGRPAKTMETAAPMRLAKRWGVA